jgi:SHS2 domain-containing protein
MGFRLLDHTADVAFEVTADSIDELFEDSAKAFYDSFIFLERLSVDLERELELRDTEIDFLLYKWLNELLFLLDTEFFAGKEIDVKIEKCDGEYNLRSFILGGKISPELVKTEPKAITMHNFRVERTEKGWRAFVVVDI